MATNRRSVVQQKGGMLQELIKQAKLVGRLIGDRRVNGLLKLIPIASIIYLISPVDLIPGAVVPVIGALDDAAVVWIGTTLFIELCPPDIVQEHRDALNGISSADGEIIDAETRDMNS
ncbi:MAG: YkvA family protein [Bacteroidota bacterium]